MRYVDALLASARLEEAKGAPTPGVSTRCKEIEDTVKELDEASHRRYRALVGKLMWLATVRPELSCPVKGSSARRAEPDGEGQPEP